MDKRTKIIITLLLSFLLTLTFTSISYSGYYTTRLISSGLFPQINNNGYIVWFANDGSEDEIYFYDGTEIIQITDNSYFDWNPKINNIGQIVWTVHGISSGSEIFFYDGTSIIRLTDNDYDEYFPEINDNGQVVWSGFDEFWNYDLEIFLYDGTSVKNISNNDFADYNPQINDKGYVVWSGDDGEVYLYDGTSVTKLPNSAYAENPQINNNGYVVWEGWDGTDWEIFLYDGTKTIQITDNSHYDQNPKISDSGYIVWGRRDLIDGYYTDSEIFLYNDSDIIQLTDNSYDDFDPEVNDKGHVVWAWGPIQHEWPFSGRGISIYDSVNITQLSDYADSYSKPQINDDDYVVWDGVFHHGKVVWSGVFLAVPTDEFTINLLSPNGSEVIPSHTTYTIKWEASTDAVEFKLKYSMNNGSTWVVIANGVTGRSYKWALPALIENKNKCLMKIIGYDALGIKVGEDTTDSTFTITIEVAKVTSPNGGETLESGNTWSISWQTNKTKKPVSFTGIYYTLDGGTTWEFKNLLRGNPEHYEWVVPSVAKTKTRCKVKVVLMDEKLNTVGSDESDKVFTIQP